MESTMIVILLVVIFKVISTQDVAQRALYLKMISPQCKHKPEIQPHQCCTIPTLFDEETVIPCSSMHQEFKEPATRGSPECAERTCLLRNNDLLFDNDEVDKDSVRQYLDNWVAKRREYMPAVKAIKESCIGKKAIFGPDAMCEADKLLFCVTCNFYNVQPYQCCTIPDLLEEETMNPCSPTQQPLNEPANRGSPECAERTCWLRNNDLLFNNDEIDRASVRQYLDNWVAKRREYMPAVNAVKENCIGEKPMFGPDVMCEADKLLFCVTCNFYNKCPNWQETENCISLRAYLENCMPYYDSALTLYTSKKSVIPKS